MKTKQATAVNPKLRVMFAACCAAFGNIVSQCETLAKATIGKGRGKEAYQAAVKTIGALETESKDANAHTVRRYTCELLAIMAKSGRMVAIPEGAQERTEKAQAARVSLGAARQRGAKSNGKKKGKSATKIMLNFEDSYRRMVKIQAGRANLILWAKLEGFDLAFSMASKAEIAKPATVAAKANGKTKPKAEQRVSA